MTDIIAIKPIGRFNASIHLPGSKSLTNRALLLAALAEGNSTLTGVLFSDDTTVMLDALRALGLTLQVDKVGTTVTVSGGGGAINSSGATLNLGNAGTAYRFLTAACCLGSPGSKYTLDGVSRMRERPIGQLVEALQEIGGRVRYLDQPNFPPLEVSGGGLIGGMLTMPPTLSSQYISALLMVGPRCAKGLGLRFSGAVTSEPYVAMTVGLMSRFGASVKVDQSFRAIDVHHGPYHGQAYAVEPDASNASYFLAAAAITPGSKCTIEGIGRQSLQGDVGFADVLHQMGAGLTFGRDFITVIGPPQGTPLRGIEIDLNRMPDMAQTLAVVALFATGATTIRNVGNLRVKETDRLAALRKELTKLGAKVTIAGDDITIEPPDKGNVRPVAIDTYDDHRMAMSFAVAGLRSPGITIKDPSCVNKTFPEFFDYLNKLCPNATSSS